jgi:CheY-like chemotaxis protein
VAKILVADDNSNIQKMVSLALRDQGIDVVAVGNGEAAVRKISDVRPDLVLADVFMPVRNGYEVCKYVKDNSSLAHIPVILLVGAFDPLDEQEAQRVGADGVLKKPFVPPDPLISMVKSALLRAANSGQASGATEKAPIAAMLGGRGPATAGGPNSTVVSAPPTVFATANDEGPAESESFVDEIPAKPEVLDIKSEGKPLAFGSLLETPVAGPAEDLVAYVAPPNPELADRDWAAEEEDVEEEEESAGSEWRRDGGSEDFAPEPTADTAEEKANARKRREGWTPTREKTQDLLEEATVSEIVAPPMPRVIREVPAPQESWAIPAAPQPELAESKTSDVVKVKATPEAAIAPPVVASAPEVASQEATKPSAGNSWFSTSSSPWEAEAQKANQLASTWDAPPVPPDPAADAAGEAQEEQPQPEPAVTYDFVSEAPSEEPVYYSPDPALVQNEIVEHNPLPGLISDGSISPETVDNIRQDTIYALESIVEDVPEKPAAASAKIAATSQQDMDALVANVLAKMSPEMLQAVTREILKPVVAAMIRDEINAKKS